MKERAYLREVQYRDDTNLNARSAFHELFSVNPGGLQRWVFDQLGLPAQERILEVGCGPGLATPKRSLTRQAHSTP